jgi:cytochrome P450
VTTEQRIVVELDRYEDVGEAWRCPHLTTRTAGAGDEEVRAGTVVRLDGEQHKQRRRAMGQLLSRGGHKYFRDTHLFPTADAALAEVLRHPGPDGRARMEVRSWSRRVNQQLAAALVGFDDATSPEGADQLFELVDRFIRGYQGVLDNAFSPFEPDGELQHASLAARDEIVRKFYEPAIERRRHLVGLVDAGDMSRDDLPQDLLSLVAQRTDPAWSDDALAKREAIFLLGAGVHTTSNSLVWTLRELFAYFAEHPEEEKRRNDETFLLAAAHEALRLHPVTAGFVRKAEEDVELPSGTLVPQDALALIRSGPPSAAPEVYGADARQFNPHRQVAKRVSANGFAFGAGPHMCFGMPIVMGAEGLDGSLVYLLKILMRAGVTADPESPDFPLAESRATYDVTTKNSPLWVILPGE